MRILKVLTKDEASDLRSLIMMAEQRRIDAHMAETEYCSARQKLESYVYRLEHPPKNPEAGQTAGEK